MGLSGRAVAGSIVYRECGSFDGALRTAILAASVLSSACDLCANDVLNRVRAPDNSMEVVVFQRDCGATTGFSTQASIGDVNAGTGNRPGNIFIATTDKGAAPSGLGGGPELKVQWLDSKTVQLAHHKKAAVVKAETSYAGFRIHYRTFE